VQQVKKFHLVHTAEIQNTGGIMTNKIEKFKDIYTCKVSGENYEYEAEYSTGKKVIWKAKIYKDDDLKGTPGGTIISNVMKDDALRQYIIAYIEGIIEKGLGIAE
jgi:hypothetical protein